jgi:multidrug resistance efflux pump
MSDQVNSMSRCLKAYWLRDRSTISRLILIAFFVAALTPEITRANEPKSDPWLMYRIMGLDDLRLSLSQMERRLEVLRVEVSRSRKLVASGAAPQIELIENEGNLAISNAERNELMALINWQSYLLQLSKNEREFKETEHFQLLVAHLEPRVAMAQSIVSLFEKRYSISERLKQRKAISSEEFERSSDDLQESKSRLIFYRSQALQARHALEIRQGKREFQQEEADILAQAVVSAHISLWKTTLSSNDHRLARLQALKSRGVVTQAEIDAVNESRKSLQQALDSAISAKPEPYPAPGRMKRPPAQLT